MGVVASSPSDFHGVRDVNTLSLREWRGRGRSGERDTGAEAALEELRSE